MKYLNWQGGVVAVGLIMFAYVADAADKLSGADIREALTDKTIIGENYAKGITVHIYAGPNGEWWSQRNPPNITKFKWSVKGDKHCKGKSCGEVVSKGEPGVYYKRLKGKERFKYTVIGDGNQLQ